jgi:type I restriction enzyme M protein
LQIPFPPLEVQKVIAAEIEGYQNEIRRLKSAIKAEERKIQATLARVWGEEKTAMEEASSR